MNRAIGMVQPIENTPQGLSASALTTIRASTARTIIIMTKTTTIAMAPPTGPISSRAICPIDLPPRRIEKNSTSMSWTPPATTTPKMIHMVPGR